MQTRRGSTSRCCLTTIASPRSFPEVARGPGNAGKGVRRLEIGDAPGKWPPWPRHRSGRRCRQSRDLPQYKSRAKVEHSPATSGSADSRYLDDRLWNDQVGALHESPDLRLDLANRHGISSISMLTTAAISPAASSSPQAGPKLRPSAVMTAIAAAAPYPARPNGSPVSLNYNFGKSAEFKQKCPNKHGYPCKRGACAHRPVSPASRSRCRSASDRSRERRHSDRSRGTHAQI